MTDTKQLLTTALMKQGRIKLAELWNCDDTTAGKKMNDQLGIKLSELSKAFDYLGIRLVMSDEDVVVKRDEVKALNLLAGRYLERRTSGNGQDAD